MTLTYFMVRLKNDHGLDNNTTIHQMVIVAQFLKHHGKSGVTKSLGLPERIVSLPREYGDTDLKRFFEACTTAERALFCTFLFTGFREQEVMHPLLVRREPEPPYDPGDGQAGTRFLAEAMGREGSAGRKSRAGSFAGSSEEDEL